MCHTRCIYIRHTHTYMYTYALYIHDVLMCTHTFSDDMCRIRRSNSRAGAAVCAAFVAYT